MPIYRIQIIGPAFPNPMQDGDILWDKDRGAPDLEGALKIARTEIGYHPSAAGYRISDINDSPLALNPRET
jgi:hypothetical protein